jgi:predicted nucleotidyltransferase
MYQECDYFIDTKGDIYIVRGYLHPEGLVRAQLIYKKDSDGERVRSNGERYNKMVIDIICYLPANEICEYFKPQDNPIRQKLDGIWLKLYQEVNKYVPEQDIGIFGSTLLDFPITRDVDFIIYGVNNCKILKENIAKIKNALGVSGISTDHIEYQTKKFSASHSLETNSLTETLANKWCSIQIAPGISNTLMFGYKPEEVTNLLIADDQAGQNTVIEGEVIDDIYTNFCPRIFSIKTELDQIYSVKTYYWAYHSCVKIGDHVIIFGKSIDNNTILLNEYEHGITIKKIVTRTI